MIGASHIIQAMQYCALRPTHYDAWRLLPTCTCLHPKKSAYVLFRSIMFLASRKPAAYLNHQRGRNCARNSSENLMAYCRCSGACATNRCPCKGAGRGCNPLCKCLKKKNPTCRNRATPDPGKTTCMCRNTCMTWRCPCKHGGKLCDEECSCGTWRKPCKNRVSETLWFCLVINVHCAPQQLQLQTAWPPIQLEVRPPYQILYVCIVT